MGTVFFQRNLLSPSLDKREGHLSCVKSQQLLEHLENTSEIGSIDIVCDHTAAVSPQNALPAKMAFEPESSVGFIQFESQFQIPINSIIMVASSSCLYQGEVSAHHRLKSDRLIHQIELDYCVTKPSSVGPDRVLVSFSSCCS